MILKAVGVFLLVLGVVGFLGYFTIPSFGLEAYWPFGLLLGHPGSWWISQLLTILLFPLGLLLMRR